MEKFLENLKHQAEENPILALAVAAGLLTATSKLVNSAAWAKEVKRRDLKDRLK
ncbi:MAG: hypothetical protein ACJ8BW_08305 [Ktedonobacteraceae bacterium]|jgi:hypothetical protein